MNYIGITSHALALISFTVLSLLLLVNWRGKALGAGLLFAVSGSIVWLVGIILFYVYPETYKLQHILELLRDYLWLYFLVHILKFIVSAERVRKFQVITATLYFIFMLSFIFSVEVAEDGTDVINNSQNLIYVLSAIFGLILIEQIYKNTNQSNKWAIKHLCVGLIVVFSYDLVLYSYIYLFKSIPESLWDARGMINTMAVPLIAVSAARNPNWAPLIAVSRKVVFYSATFTIAGIYLVFMAGVGIYIKEYGGEWGTLAQVVFLYGVIILLTIFILSGKARAKLKLFVSENFYNYKFDYREEWLRLMRIMSTSEEGITLYQKLIKAIAQIVESPGGILWLKQEHKYVPVEGWNAVIPDGICEDESSDFISLLKTQQSVINLQDMRKSQGKYQELILPEWVDKIDKSWLVVPVSLDENMYAYIVLLHSKIKYQQSWEDSELLRTVGQQVASYLAQYESARQLAEVRQFEAFNRLSAFVVHDLNNLVSQLDLIVSNAQNHINNPDFVKDAIKTVDSAVSKMNRLLEQLKQGGVNDGYRQNINLYEELSKIVNQDTGRLPKPELFAKKTDINIVVTRDSFISIIRHLINNAQDATNDQGKITILLSSDKNMATIEISDTGHGMTRDFINNRLFKPFDTTKGNAGMGIGVFESREFVRQCGGYVEVKSTVDVGSNFVLWFPLATSETVSNH